MRRFRRSSRPPAWFVPVMIVGLALAGMAMAALLGHLHF